MLVRNAFTHDSRVESEARTLTDAGYRVTVVAEGRPGLPAREERDGIAVVRVPRGVERRIVLRYLAYRRRLLRTTLATRPDIIHANDTDTLEVASTAARRLGVPVVYDSHELWLGRLPRGRSRPYFLASQAFYWVIERLFMPRAAAWIVANPPVAGELERRYGLRGVRVVANYPRRIGPDRAREIRSLPGGGAIPADVPIVLYLGGLLWGRGLEELVDAMANVPGAHLVLLGDGQQRDDLLARARRLGIGERIHALEPVPHEQVIDYAASATIGVSPIVPSCLSYALALPNKLFQYMAAGLPVVGSDFPQIRDALLPSGAGLTVDTRRPSEIAAALRRLLDDPERAREMGRRGAQAVAERFNWGTSAGALLDVYRGVRPATP